MFPPLETMSILILQTSPATSGGQMEGQRCQPCGVFGNLISFSLHPPPWTLSCCIFFLVFPTNAIVRIPRGDFQLCAGTHLRLSLAGPIFKRTFDQLATLQSTQQQQQKMGGDFRSLPFFFLHHRSLQFPLTAFFFTVRCF